MTMTQVSYPSAPTITRRKGTLLDAATVGDDFAWLDGEALFDSFNCLDFGAQPVFCGPNSKTLDAPDGWIDGVRFGAYGGINCKAVGIDKAEAEARVREAFLAGESTAVEAGLMEYRFRVNTDVDTLPGEWAAPTDLTPAGGAMRAAAGVALLEGHVSRYYAGSPVLHLPVSLASMLAATGGLEVDGNVLRTKTGVKVVAGAGYEFPNYGPAGTEPAAGELWAYATGEVSIQRSELILRSAFDQTNNDLIVLAERGYIAAVDCIAAAVRVKFE